MTVKERASAALASLQRNAYAMGMLRSRLESRINFILNEGGSGSQAEGYQELVKVLELVKNGELILNVLSEKVESARFLEEFIMIIDSATSSVSEIKDDVEQLVPMAEAALQEMHDAIAKISTGLCSPELKLETELAILQEAGSAAADVAKNSAALIGDDNNNDNGNPNNNGVANGDNSDDFALVLESKNNTNTTPKTEKKTTSAAITTTATASFSKEDGEESESVAI